MTLAPERARQPPVTTGPQPSAPTKAPTRGQLPQLDLVRVLTFAAVVAVHSSSFSFYPTSEANGASLMTLHFTREVFFVITGFVLLHSYGRREFSVRRFYTRRVSLVGLPYLLWSLVYNAVNIPVEPTHGLWWRTLGYDLITGRASYQLYFLLVSLQAYLALPLLIRLVRRTEGHHGRLVAASVALQLGVTELVQAVVLHVHGAAQVAIVHADVYLPTYQLYFLAGALAAWHLPRLQPWVETHGRVILAALAGSGAIMLTAYFLQVPSYGAQEAQNVLQPAEVPWSLAVALGLYWLGSRYAARPRTGPLTTFFTVGARLSFGVYLIHPLMLDVLLDRFHLRAGPQQALPSVLATLVLVVLAVPVAAVATALLQRTPLGTALTGREATTRPRAATSLAALAVVGALVAGAYVTEQALAPSLATIAGVPGS
jgi:peptidoglycan/LPS O-acetylase OafA/YrhL